MLNKWVINTMFRISFLILLLVSFISCAPRETHNVLQPQQMPSLSVPSTGPIKVAIGEFINRSTYMNGIFADSGDRLGKQAKQILTTHLTQSRAFTVLDRSNLEALEYEAKLAKNKQELQGANVLLTGAVTEFGRKETGTKSLGGLIHETKTQTLYAKVALSVVDPKTSAVLDSFQGSGEYNLTNKQVLGFGGQAGYDSTLADKVLNLAIMEALQRMIEAKSANKW